MNTLLLLALSALSAPAVETTAKPATQLYVHTEPSGAAVRLDGKPVGKSDDLFVVPPGVSRITLDVDLDGHYTQHKEIVVRGGRITRVELKMEPQPAGKAKPAAGRDAVAAAKEAVETISTLSEMDVAKWRTALDSLKGLDEAVVVREVAKFLDSKENTLRRSAIFILSRGEFKSIEPAVAGLLRLCDHEEDMTRGMAALALGGNRVEKSLPRLIKMTTDDKSGYARRCGAIALGMLGDQQAIPVLEKALKDADPLVGNNAEAALRMIKRAQEKQQKQQKQDKAEPPKPENSGKSGKAESETPAAKID